MDIILIVIAVLQAYILGSINFAVIFTNLFIKKDVRDFGSGNAGMTNVLRVAGPLPGILTFICDAAKGAVSCFVGRYVIFDYLFKNYPEHGDFYLPIYGALLCGVFCMIGHVFPAFFQFKGGKAVAVSVGIFAIVDWRCISVALGIFVIILLISRIISISSLIATASMPVCIACFSRNTGERVWVSVLLTLVMVLIIYLKHIENIKRLIKGEEKPLFGKNKKEN
ncbi:MAG: glycerol-3-phosphate 1-O-acyltransferase PlsY [Clostridia bacterium]|nr:glycerol-3-phosphate 1-O-acyltransferase PlsY [Clostridia bacterium]